MIEKQRRNLHSLSVLIALCYAALVCQLSLTKVQAVKDCLLQSVCYCLKQR